MSLPPLSAAPPMPARAGAAPSLPVTSPVLHNAVVDGTFEVDSADAPALPDGDVERSDVTNAPRPSLDDLAGLDDHDSLADDAATSQDHDSDTGADGTGGRSLVLIEDGKVVHAPADVYVVDVTALTGPDRSAEDLFEALKNLRAVAPSKAREGLADRLTAGLRDRLSV